MHSLRRLVRLAGRLGDARRPRAEPDRDLHFGDLHHSWDALQADRRRLALAHDCGFTHCLPVLREEIRLRIEALHRSVAALRVPPRTPAESPGASDWVAELRALEAEFGELEIDDRRCVLRVVTEPIALKRVELGPFALELVWSRFGETRGAHCFDILALEPNPAGGRDRVTHPHVQDGTLCAGDAAAPIERALADGRLGDAFALVRSVLETYNPKSAYVGLDEWHGTPCSDCGDRTDREESYYCTGCHSDLCEDCSSCCRSCEETRCDGCLEPCAGCSDPTCSRCLDEVGGGKSACRECRADCRDCSELFLRKALSGLGLCDDCLAAEEADESDLHPEPEPESEPEVQSELELEPQSELRPLTLAPLLSEDLLCPAIPTRPG